MKIVRFHYLYHCIDCFITYEIINNKNQTGNLYVNDNDPTMMNVPFYRGTFDICCRVYKLKTFI